MIDRIVESAIQNRCLSVASEGLICQVVGNRMCTPADLNALQVLVEAIERGDIHRESKGQMSHVLQGVAMVRK